MDDMMMEMVQLLEARVKQLEFEMCFITSRHKTLQEQLIYFLEEVVRKEKEERDGKKD